MGNLELARWYAALLGVALVIFGFAGFLDNPVVGRPSAQPVFVSGTTLNLLHVGAGAVALFVAFGLTPEGLVWGLAGFGLGFAALLLASIVSPTLAGLSDVQLSRADQALYAGLATLSVVVAWLARREALAERGSA
ncbi:MAG TPA: hypothetical protein VMP67_03220 [Candidatus Limnocylindria bacterium]|nr:hypothetical protein [Candidatus Limnocylindria bacterium]